MGIISLAYAAADFRVSTNDEGNMFFQVLGSYLPNYMESHPRRLQSWPPVIYAANLL
jgi:hypothetical protein